MMITAKKIMIADDDEGILEMMSTMLELEGYDVTAVSDGTGLVDMNENLPDLLLLDIWMSGSDGRDICRQLKQSPHTGHLPILLVSASRDVERSALASGANGFIAKPFDMHVFLEKVREQLGI